MRVDDGQQVAEVADERQTWPREHHDSVSPEYPAVGNPARFDPFDQESVMLNLDASLRIRARHQFFGWTQGTLQSLVEHQLLICALQNEAPTRFYVDSFSTVPVEPTHFSELFRQDVFLVPHLIKSWEENHNQVITFEAGNGDQFAGSALARELTRLGASHIVAHGTHDATGQVTGFLTPREREILEWIYRGKSNIEVGMILKISPLTAKNHVQKILRKLGVLNRTQAVGKALALRILNT